jgi:hypothetical protein
MNPRTCAVFVLLLLAGSSLFGGNSSAGGGNRFDATWIAPSPLSYGAGAPPLFRKSFLLAGRPVRASVRVIGLGHYALYVNGKRAGESLINQPWSQYNKTIYWQEFDLRHLVRKGENVIGVLLGDSFWRVGGGNDPMRYVKTDAMPDFSKGTPYLLRLEASILMEGGKEVRIASDGSWKWNIGPLTSSNIYAGEDFDARRDWPGWKSPGYDDTGWKQAVLAPSPGAALEGYAAPPLKAHEIFAPVGINTPKKGEYTYLFPQNCSALLRYSVSGKAGQTIRFKPCEYMDSTGQVKFTYTWGTNKDIWHDYTLRGNGVESHQTLFCYVGCQYVGMTGGVPEGFPNPEGLPVVKNLGLVHVRAACPSAGSFSCSSALQNGAHRLIDWAIRSNVSYVETDCPHREKNGWQEETWHMARAVSYAYDTRSLLRKIARDIRDTQLPDGHIPTNCPNYLVGVPPHGYWNEAPEWGISGVLVPWHLYEWYGDTSALAAGYESMKKYVDYLTSQAKDGIITSNLGDWCDYGHGKPPGNSQWTPNEVTATAIWAIGAATVSRAAVALDRPSDMIAYRGLFDRIRKEFQRHFYDPATKTVRNNGSCQAAHSIALCAGLIPDRDRKEVLRGIVNELEKRNWQQTVGEVTQVFFVRALAEGGRNDVLHRVYARETRGSYGYMVRQGLTTLPESWDATPGTGMSMNHYMLGHLMEWHYAYVAGIRQQPGSTGWRRVIIAPEPGALTSARASFQSPRGRIAVDWTRKGKRFEMTVTVPRGMEAEAIMPEGEHHSLRPGVTTLKGDFSVESMHSPH